MVYQSNNSVPIQIFEKKQTYYENCIKAVTTVVYIYMLLSFLFHTNRFYLLTRSTAYLIKTFSIAITRI